MQEVIGVDNANTFIELSTPRDWDDVVRVHQLDAAIAGLRTELKSDISDVRLEIAGLKTEIARGFQRQNAWMAGFMGTLLLSMLAATFR